MTRHSITLTLTAATSSAGLLACGSAMPRSDGGLERALPGDGCIASVSADDDDGNVPANAVDGDLGTRWSSAGKGSWIQAELGEAQAVGSVAIAWYKGDERRAHFEIEVSADAITWHTVHSGDSSGDTEALETYAFQPVSAGFVRVTVDGNTDNDWASITELQVHGDGSCCGGEPAAGGSTGADASEGSGSSGPAADDGDQGPAPACGGPAFDANGVAYLDIPGFSYAGGVERFDWTENFKDNGSMRHDFEGTTEGNQCVLGYFVVDGPSGEEISAKLGGGPHNDDDPEWADTHDLGLVRFSGDEARLRFEEEHPDYSDSIPSQESFDFGDITGKWIGAMGCKLNLDQDGDGTFDHVWYLGFIDPEGLDAADKPSNGWVKTLDLQLHVDDVALKSPTVPYVTTIGEPQAAQATIRIDEQDPDEYQYRYVAYRSPVPCSP